MSSKPPDPRAETIKRLTRELLDALGYAATGDLQRTPERVAELWTEHLVRPQADLEQLLGSGLAPTDASNDGTNGNAQPIAVVDMGVHLVCPHHLTVAFGRAHVAYLPGAQVLGFGTISELVQLMTSRLVLQERATQDIADALVRYAGAKAAAVSLQATHPCHNVSHARSHDAQAVSWAFAGDPSQHASLRETVSLALQSRLPSPG